MLRGVGWPVMMSKEMMPSVKQKNRHDKSPSFLVNTIKMVICLFAMLVYWSVSAGSGFAGCFLWFEVFFFKLELILTTIDFCLRQYKVRINMFMDVHIDVQSSYEEIYPQFLVVGLELVTRVASQDSSISSGARRKKSGRILSMSHTGCLLTGSQLIFIMGFEI